MSTRDRSAVVAQDRPRGRRSLALLAVAVGLVAHAGCALVLGEYTVKESRDGEGGGGAGLPGVECTGPEQCTAPTDRCVDNYCRQACLVKEDCYYHFSECSDGYCSKHVGEACGSSEACGGLECITVDNRGLGVAGYCTMYCSHAGQCPLEFECIEYDCRVVGDDGPLCFVWQDQPCSSCALNACEWELQECCGYSSPCGGVQATIDACDDARTWDACNDLYGPNDGDDPSSRLLDCITLNCEGACYNPCPGDACRDR